ncbi:GNAT family N-acetyltransferase [Streptomyces purpurascens]|uniref:GNAT family N-acetyltransferase n=1 Tax=Streptomyces purpurascens TaxID=1924 RepID=UPI0016758B3D|nr:GNAT family N-acetyltransferase [Streptomyces purpurascens]MCE7045742.1 GNAT family N-acetyltransferase [Streptomyces purpurascens]GHA08728.1 acetyltransferase [Streptomyces purpurascens]
MPIPTARLRAPSTPTAPALLLRPWTPGDAAGLAALCGDDALHRWTSFAVDDETSAARWLREQQRGWEQGRRYAFAVEEVPPSGADGLPAGHVVLKDVALGTASAEVGYWTAAHARGRGIASRALNALTDWAFTTFAPTGLTRLELLHQAANTASCRVADKSHYPLTGIRPAQPPGYPQEGHVHVRHLAEGAGPPSAC